MDHQAISWLVLHKRWFVSCTQPCRLQLILLLEKDDLRIILNINALRLIFDFSSCSRLLLDRLGRLRRLTSVSVSFGVSCIECFNFSTIFGGL